MWRSSKDGGVYGEAQGIVYPGKGGTLFMCAALHIHGIVCAFVNRLSVASIIECYNRDFGASIFVMMCKSVHIR